MAVTFKDLMAPVFNQALKAGHVGLVTDTMYKQQSIKSYKHVRRHLGVLFNNGVCNKSAPSECQQHWPGYGGKYLQ